MEMGPAEAKVMRAIAARERRRAAAERRDAQQARSEAETPARSTTRWSTKPDRRGKPSAIEQRLAKSAAKAKEDWARRHPRAAKQERGLRKSRAEMLESFKHKNQGTPETHAYAARVNQGALARLYLNEVIDRDQLAAAVAIGQVAERIGADVAVKTSSIETRVDVTRMGDGAFYENLTRVREEVAYTRWRSEVRGPIGAILEMIVGEPAGFTIVAKRYRIGNKRAKRLLIDALDLWPRILGTVCKEIDDATLAAAHAGILG
jgi:hypothetical protein